MDASAAVSTTVQPSGTVTLPVGVVEDVNASVNKTATPSDTATVLVASDKDSNVSLIAASNTAVKGIVSIEIAKDLNVTVSMPTKDSASGIVFAEKAGKHVTSESSDVSFHTVEDVAMLPSDLEVSGTDEENSVFESEKDDLPRAETSNKMTKLWPQRPTRPASAA